MGAGSTTGAGAGSAIGAGLGIGAGAGAGAGLGSCATVSSGLSCATSVGLGAATLDSSRMRTAVCTGGSTGRLGVGARWRDGRMVATCWVTSSGLLCCATRGGRFRSAAGRRVRCRLMPRCTGGALAVAVLLSGVRLLKICTITACMACCTGQYRLTTHSKRTCKASTPNSTAGRLRSGGASAAKMNLKVTV